MPPSPPEEVRGHAIAAARALAGKRPAYWTLQRIMEAALLANLPLEPPMIDLGCGDGVFSSAVFPAGLAFGVDRGTRTTQQALHQGQYRAIVQADGHDLPFATGSLKTVFSNSVIEHIPDLDNLLSEIARILEPGGRLICSVPTPRYNEWLLGTRLAKALGWERGEEAYPAFVTWVFTHLNVFNANAWERRCANAGLTVTSVESYGSPFAWAIFDIFLWVAVPGHVIHTLTGYRPFVGWRWWADLLARTAGSREVGAGYLFVAERTG